jgi:uncharacterized protein YuzB (UPF0349 family)
VAIDNDVGISIIISGKTKEELQDKIKQYIKNNPSSIVEEQQ